MSEGAFRCLIKDFSAKFDELNAVSHLRLEESSIEFFTEDIMELEETVRSLESKLRDVQLALAQEKEALPKMEAVVKACCAQHAHLSFLAENLPAHLPGQQGGHSQPQQLRGSGSGAADSYLDASSNGENDASHANTSRPNSADCLGDKKKRPPAPRWYITNDELSSLSSYMTARLTLEKVNAAVDDAAAMGEAVVRMLATARAKGKMATLDRKRAQMLMVNVAGKEGVKGHYWFTEADMKNANVLRPDKTGRSLLTVLRHLGRIQEVRLNVEGSMQPVYTLR